MKRRLLNFLIFIHAVISRTAAIEPAAGLPKLGSIRRHAAALLTGVSLIGVSSPLFSSPVPVFAISQSETQLINIFERNTPSCVYINTFYNQLNAFSTDVSQIPAGTGTGFVWRDSKTKQFFVVTNYHVVRNSAGARITFLGKGDGKPVVVDAGIRGVDPDKDICVLSLEKAPTELLARLEPVRLGTSSTLRVGQQALAIGNPFGLDHTLTTGIISGLGRMVTSPSGRPISNVIQTDAAINPGNSGGPLLDSDGNLIGMNTAIYSTTGSSSGIGFAIPVDTVRYEVETLIREGRVERPIIGITYLESSRAQDVGIGTGVLVLGVPPGSSADRAGLRGTRRVADGTVDFGDIITGMSPPPGKSGSGDSVYLKKKKATDGDSSDFERIETETDLFRCLEGHSLGEEVKVRVIRRVAVEGGYFPEEVILRLKLTVSSGGRVLDTVDTVNSK